MQKVSRSVKHSPHAEYSAASSHNAPDHSGMTEDAFHKPRIEKKASFSMHGHALLIASTSTAKQGEQRQIKMREKPIDTEAMLKKEQAASSTKKPAKKEADWDDEVSTEGTRLLQLRKDLIRACDDYDSAKEYSDHQEKEFAAKEVQLRQMEEDLQRQLAKFNRFLQENDSKRSRAERKAVDEAKLVVEKQREITGLSRELDIVSKERKQRAEEVQRLSVYAKYLLEFLERVDGFNQPEEVIERFTALRNTEKMLMERKETLQAELESMQKEYQKLRFEMKSETARMSHNLARAQEQQEHVADAAIVAQRGFEDDRRRAAQKRTLATEVHSAVDNMYHRCMKESASRGTHRPHAHSLIERLHTLQEFVEDMMSVVVPSRRNGNAGAIHNGNAGATSHSSGGPSSPQAASSPVHPNPLSPAAQSVNAAHEARRNSTANASVSGNRDSQRRTSTMTDSASESYRG